MDIVEELDGFVNYLHGHRGDPKRLCNNAAAEIVKLRSQVSALQAENEELRKVGVAVSVCPICDIAGCHHMRGVPTKDPLSGGDA